MSRRIKQTARWAGGALLMGAMLLAGGAGAEPDAPQAVLYDQTSTGNVQEDWVASSNFEPILDAFDSQGADDFQVPADEIWTITTVTARGHYDGGGSTVVDSVLVQFYGNSGSNLPTNLLRSETIPGASVAGRDTGVFVMNITPLTLGPGRYWFSAQANKNFTESKQWAWNESTVQFLSPSAWRQPGDGYSTGCTTFLRRIQDCQQPATSANPDLLFKLEGTVIPITNQVRLPIILR